MLNIFCSVSAKEKIKVESWLIPSLLRQKYDEDIILHLIHYTGKGALGIDGNVQGKLSIQEWIPEQPLGFGDAHNFAFANVQPKEHFLIINPDVYMHEECIDRLIDTMRSSEGKAGIVEARQLPFEHPKEYDAKTKYTPWASGFGILVNSAFFAEVGGFDSHFWMYCEDVDLSWRAWLAGYAVLHESQAVGYHFTGGYFEYNTSRWYLENFWGARNFLYISQKYFGNEGYECAYELCKAAGFPSHVFQDIVHAAQDAIQDNKDELDVFYQKYEKKIEDYKNIIRINGFNSYHDNSFSVCL